MWPWQLWQLEAWQWPAIQLQLLSLVVGMCRHTPSKASAVQAGPAAAEAADSLLAETYRNAVLDLQATLQQRLTRWPSYRAGARKTDAYDCPEALKWACPGSAASESGGQQTAAALLLGIR